MRGGGGWCVCFLVDMVCGRYLGVCGLKGNSCVLEDFGLRGVIFCF